jgi:hypothetical protein
MANSSAGKVSSLVCGTEHTGVSLHDVKSGAVVAHDLKLYVNHPNYSSIFSLLMASAVNRLLITVWHDPSARIEQVQFNFPA